MCADVWHAPPPLGVCVCKANKYINNVNLGVLNLKSTIKKNMWGWREGSAVKSAD